MTDVTKIGAMTVIAAADIADKDHPINTTVGSQYNDQAGVGKVLGRMYLRDNGSSDYDIVIPISLSATGNWILFEAGTAITPS